MSQSDAMHRESHEGFEGTRKEKYPKSILTFSNAKQKGKIHPTQKPIEMFEYLIKTFSKERDTILDNCMGSFTTAVACVNTNRQYIGFENDNTYFELGQKRLDDLHIINNINTLKVL